MSFYTGRHRLSNGAIKRQLHITHGQHSLSYMQGGVQADTVFHTDVKYVTFDIYKPISRTKVAIYSSGQYEEPPFNQDAYDYAYKTYIQSFSNECMSRITTGGYGFIIVRTNGEIYMESSNNVGISCIWFEGMADVECSDGDGNSVGQPFGYFPNGGNVWSENARYSAYGPWIHPDYMSSFPGYVHTDCTDAKYRGNISSSQGDIAYIAVLNFKYDGSINNYPIATNGEILINRDNFLVNGIEVSKMKLLSVGAVNIYDNKFKSPGTKNNNSFQLINSVAPQGGMLFSSNDIATIIQRGGKTVLDSRFTFPTLSGSRTYPIPVYSNSLWNRWHTFATINHKRYKNGDLICGFSVNHGAGYNTQCGRIVNSLYKYTFIGVYEEGRDIALTIVFYTTGSRNYRHIDSRARLKCYNGTVYLQGVASDDNSSGAAIESSYLYSGKLVILDFN